MVFQFTIDGQPVAKGRPRMSKCGKIYAAPKSKKWEDAAAMVISKRWRSPANSRPVRLSIVALFERPKGMAGSERKPHVKRPDLDNISKALMDAINKAGVWIDDRQVYALEAQAWYCAPGEKPCIKAMLRFT